MNAAIDTRQRILESARDLIYARSYADVGVAAICASAGVKKGSFYHFFPSKVDLTLAVIDEFFVEFKQRIFAEAFSPSIAPLDRFKKLTDLAYRFQKDIADATGHTLGCPFGNIAAEMSTQDEHLRQKVQTIFKQVENNFRETLEEALSRGDIEPIDVSATAQAMLAYAEGIMLVAKTRNDPEVIRQLLPAIADIRIRN
jgi:TetR/AcrR family transcriptional regulator, transcriptional repressor for nem operon